MAKYLLKVSYTPEGIKGVMKSGGSRRVAAVGKALTGVGGSLESFYFALGRDDVYVIADIPDNSTAVALGATITSSGAISRYETVALVTPAEVDSAMMVRVDYVAPGS